MSERKQLSKRVRFEVFKRDGFTCQYCGARPPAAVLEIDHIDAIANGGGNEEDNLVTACDHCNRGKSDRPLGDFRPRPDADLLFLETQQEIAELRRFKAGQEELARLRVDVIERLQDAWCATSGLEWCPKDSDLTQMLSKFNAEDVLRAVESTANKVASGVVSDRGFVQYMWGILHSMRRQSGEDGGRG